MKTQKLTKKAKREARTPWLHARDFCRTVSSKPCVWQLREGHALPTPVYLMAMNRALRTCTN